MNDPAETLAPLAALIDESRLMADRYRVVMPDGSQRYAADGFVDVRSTHSETRAVQASVAELDVELARIEAQLDRLWQHMPGAVADEEGEAFDRTVATLSALRRALVPADPDEGLGIVDRLRARVRRLDQALAGRGDSDELRHWNADGAGRIRVIEDACILLEEAAGHMAVDADLAASVRWDVESLRLATTGRAHRGNDGIRVLWRDQPSAAIRRASDLMERLATRISSI